jgi:lipopolysaccharide transport system ATP-binding protein
MSATIQDSVIKVFGLSKAYRIGLKDLQHDTLGAALGSWIKSPFTNYKRVKNLARVNLEDDSPDIFWALRDINFEVKRGDVLGIIGKNGAGKSTLLKILSRITEPSAGRVEIYGRVASLLEVGTGFNLELTGRENVFLNGTILGMTKKEIESKFDEILAFSGIEKFIDTPVKRYSSGMKVRLAFAVAAHLDPEILIIDEVLAVGDLEFQKKCLGKMSDIAETEGRTVLFVSHDMAAVQKLCTKGICLVNGRVKFSGSASEAVDFYFKSWVNTSAMSTGLDPSGRRGDGPVKVIAVETLSIGLQPLTNFKIGQPIVFKITVRADTDLKSVLVGIAIKSISGVEIFHSTSRYSEVGDIMVKGDNILYVQYDPNVLMPDMYSLRISLNWNAALSDRVDEVGKFEVDNTADDIRLIPDFKVGNFYYPLTWKKETIDQ